MRIIVCGGRNFRSPFQVWKELDAIHAETPITELLHGGATGVDTYAREWGASKGIQLFRSVADWKRFGRRAGPIRNAKMLTWKPDMVVAFPGGKGTANMVALAKLAGVRVKEIR